jgi:biotin carboxyl carrier protein
MIRPVGTARRGGGVAGEVRAEMVANVWKVVVSQGDTVAEGDTLVILESMKMEIPVVAPCNGTVTAVHVEPDGQVKEGDLVIEIDES